MLFFLHNELLMNKEQSKLKLLWLSHILSNNTPSYGGGEGGVIEDDKNISCGDSCNTAKLTFSNHLGSHVDSPRHFVENGVTTESYIPEDWVFEKPFVIHLNISASEIVTQEHIEIACAKVDDADLVLLKTGFETHRDTKKYWEEQPGFASELAEYLIGRFKSFTAIGFDTISISSYQHRELGRDAHKAFLNKGIRIFEDLSLESIEEATSLVRVIALPLRFENSDGAPCSVVGWVSDED